MSHLRKQVKYKKQDVHFPQGWGVLAPTAPGAANVQSETRVQRASWRCLPQRAFLSAGPTCSQFEGSGSKKHTWYRFWNQSPQVYKEHQNVDNWALQFVRQGFSTRFIRAMVSNAWRAWLQLGIHASHITWLGVARLWCTPGDQINTAEPCTSNSWQVARFSQDARALMRLEAP